MEAWQENCLRSAFKCDCRQDQWVHFKSFDLHLTPFYSVRVKYSSKMTFVGGHSTRWIHWNKNLHCVTFTHIKVRNCLIKVLETIKTNRNENFGIYTLQLKFQIPVMSLFTMNMANDFILWYSNTDKICLSYPKILKKFIAPLGNSVRAWCGQIFENICVTRSIDLNSLFQYLACLEILLNKIM